MFHALKKFLLLQIPMYQLQFQFVSRAQKISTVVDLKRLIIKQGFHALKKFLLLQMGVVVDFARGFHALKKFLLLQIRARHNQNNCFTRSKNFYCCRSPMRFASSTWVSRAQKISTVVDWVQPIPRAQFHALKKFLLLQM